MLRAMRARPVVFGFAAVVAGCCGMCAETTQSENIRTEGMAADMQVASRGDGKTHVDVTLRVGGPLSNLHPQITGGDQLEVTNGIDTIPLSFGTHLLARPSYHGVLPGDSGGQTVQLRFVRARDKSALGTKIIMPPGFAITSPRAGETYSPARSALAVRWGPAGPGSVEWSVRGGCITDQRGVIAADTGALDVALAAAPPPDGGPPPSRCDVTVKLERTARGVVDPAFGRGGSVSASQQRERVVEFTP